MVAALLPMGLAPAAATTGELVITGVIDGPLSGGVPKAIELYSVVDVPDLSVFGVGSANNGGGTDGEEFTFPAVGASAGNYIYVASEGTGFTDFFGFAPDYTSSAASINGDDAIELLKDGAVVDVFGEISGGPGAWNYEDGWAYRVNGTGHDGTTFVLGNWTFSGPNALDGETSNATATTPFPVGTYAATVVDVPPTVSSTDPASGDTAVAIDADVVVTFSEPVTTAADWYDVVCDTSTPAMAVSTTDSTTYTLNPDADFANDESCTVTVFAASVSDLDEPVNPMTEDSNFTFTVEGVPRHPRRSSSTRSTTTSPAPTPQSSLSS